MKVRYSKQRELILENIQNRYDHPTAEMIYQDLKADAPQLSLGTVYRNLNQLVEYKQIKKLDVGHGRVHYEGHLEPHMHFVCDCCGTVYDIFYNDDTLIKQFQDMHDHDMHDVDIIMSGICRKCKEAA